MDECTICADPNEIACFGEFKCGELLTEVFPRLNAILVTNIWFILLYLAPLFVLLVTYMHFLLDPSTEEQNRDEIDWRLFTAADSGVQEENDGFYKQSFCGFCFRSVLLD